MLSVPVTAFNQIRPYKKEDGVSAAAPAMLLQLGIHYRPPHQKISKHGYINLLGLGKKNTASELAPLKGQAGLTPVRAECFGATQIIHQHHLTATRTCSFPPISLAGAHTPAASGDSGTVFYWSPLFHTDYAFTKIKDKLLGLVYNRVIRQIPVSQKRCPVFCSSRSKGLQTL